MNHYTIWMGLIYKALEIYPLLTYTKIIRKLLSSRHKIKRHSNKFEKLNPSSIQIILSVTHPEILPKNSL